MERRNIPAGLLEPVLNNPQQVLPSATGRHVYQSKVDFGTGKTYLLRAVVSDQTDPAVVVTVYRTSKVDKYWRQ